MVNDTTLLFGLDGVQVVRVVGRHPCRGVASPTVVQAPLKILTPAEYVRLHAHLRDDYARLMVDVLLESGCRWGEFAALRVGDLDPVAGTLTVVGVDPKYVPAAECGFRVKEYPKNRCWRKVAISPELVARLTGLTAGRRRDALLFPAVGGQTGRRSELASTTVEPEGFTVAGRRFTHGTLYAYTKGLCRCESCREAVAAYRVARRGQGQDRPPQQQVPEEVRLTRHMRRDWFRNRVLRPAIEAAGLDWRPRVHDLRHASASWALAGGATVQQVREHLGHTSLRAVERYLHNLPGAEAGAAGAIARIRATGALYPLVTPSYTPVPLVSTTTTAPEPASPLEQAGDDAPSSAPQVQEQASSDPAATEPQNEAGADTHAEFGPSLIAAAVAPTAETMIIRSELLADAASPAARGGGPEAKLVAIVDADAPGEELAAEEQEPGLNRERIPARKRSTPPQGRGSRRSRHCSTKKRRGGTGQNDQFRVQDRYAGDGQQTDTRTTPRDAGSAHAESPVTGREQQLERLRPKPRVPTLASEDRHTPTAQPPWRVAVEPNLSRPASQTSSVPKKGSERSDPLTNHGQRTKKPISSTSGDRLSPAYIPSGRYWD